MRSVGCCFSLSPVNYRRRWISFLVRLIHHIMDGHECFYSKLFSAFLTKPGTCHPIPFSYFCFLCHSQCPFKLWRQWSIQETHRPYLCQGQRRVRRDSEHCDMWSHRITRQGECHLLVRVPVTVVGRTHIAMCTEGPLDFSGPGGCLKRASCGFHSTVT